MDRVPAEGDVGGDLTGAFGELVPGTVAQRGRRESLRLSAQVSVHGGLLLLVDELLTQGRPQSRLRAVRAAREVAQTIMDGTT